MINLNATGENVGDMVSAIARCPPRTVDNALDPEQQQKAALRNQEYQTMFYEMQSQK